jgi:hypothetical protein
MTHNVTPAAPPQWLLQIMHEVDTLKFGEGLSHMTEDTDMYFGTTHVHGADAIKAFFVRIDEPLHTSHQVLEFWTADDGVCLVRGEATMAKKTEPGTVVRDPFMHIYYLDTAAQARIKTLRITVGPLQTDAIM